MGKYILNPNKFMGNNWGAIPSINDGFPQFLAALQEIEWKEIEFKEGYNIMFHGIPITKEDCDYIPN
jgi:hypothetical protein